MKLSFTLFATILSLASPSCAIAAGSKNKQGKQLRGGGRNAMVVTEQELGKPQERRMANDNELDEVVIRDFDDDTQDDDEDDDEDDTDKMQAFIDFVDVKEVSASPEQKKTVLVEGEDNDDDDDLDEEDDDEDDAKELQAFIDFVNSKEKLDIQQKKAIIVEEEDDDNNDDVYFEDEHPGRCALISEGGKDIMNEHPKKTRALGRHGKKCYWYHGYKRCYYHHNY